MFATRYNLSASESSEFFLMAGLSWLITVASAAAALFACYVSNFKFAPTLIPPNLPLTLFALAFFAVSVFFKNNYFFLSISNAVATISAFIFVGAVFSYAATHYSSSFELWDATLASTDELFRFDWPALLRWVDAHRSIADILRYAYESYFDQAVAVVIILSFLGQYRRLQMLVLAFQISALSCSVIAAFIPAVGEFPFRKIDPTFEFSWVPSTATSPVAEVMQLRTITPIIPLDSLEGVITFPSFHAALGLLFIWAFWKSPVVRWIAIVLNAAMIASTPVIGGHYFIDAVAGLLVACASILIAQGIVRSIMDMVCAISRRGAFSQNAKATSSL